MKYIISITILVVVSTNALSQINNKNLFKRFYNNHLKIDVEQKNTQFFAEISPQFFAFSGYGAGLGFEFNRFQTGFISLKTNLTPAFRDAIFDNANDISIPKNAAAEVFANVFLRKDRKGFYAGTIYSYDWYTAIDTKTQQSEDFTKQYAVARLGFRWFPFKEYFYIDGGYGISFNLSGSEKHILGNTEYSPKTVIGLPFFSVGGRIFLTSNK